MKNVARPGLICPVFTPGWFQFLASTPSSEIEAKLGYVDEPELIHRDNLVLL